MTSLTQIHDVTEKGIRTLMEALRWGGAAYHNAGWNGRHIEGIEHFFFYALEYMTRKKFIHGQPVCLGVFIGSLLHNNRPDEMLTAIHQAGVDIRPQAMNVTWKEVAETLKGLSCFVEKAGYWYSIANEAVVDDAIIDRIRSKIEITFGPWLP
jgi:glycerol dehydrogenase-like iron-containing ADH family enzyme